MQFSISAQFSSIWSIDRILSGATTLGYNLPGGDINEGVLQQYWNLTINLFSVISRKFIGEVLPICQDAVCVFHIHSRLGKYFFWKTFTDSTL